MSRLRAYAGLWGLVAVVGATLVFLLSAAAPTVNRVQDTALRRTGEGRFEVEIVPTKRRNLSVT